MGVDPEQYREKSRESWNRFAPNWEAEREFLWASTGGLGERLVDNLDPQPGDSVLELACGTGDTGFLAAERVGPDGRLVATDFAAEMVEVARANAERRGIENAEFRVEDAERLGFDDASFDRALCRFGYMLMADPAAALAETRRVLRDGGRLSFAVWAGPDRNVWAAIPGMTLVELGHLPPPNPEEPGIFAIADPGRIRSLVTAAGFGEPRIEEVPVAWAYDDADAHWDKTLALAAPIADAWVELGPEDRERVRTTVRERVEARLAEDPRALDGVALAVVAE